MSFTRAGTKTYKNTQSINFWNPYFNSRNVKELNFKVVANFKLAWFYEKLDDFVNTNLLKNSVMSTYTMLETMVIYMKVK